MSSTIGHISLDPSKTFYVVIFLSAYVLYGLCLAGYRLYLSPLAKFPGPKLAAATHWFKAYYDLVAEGGGGQFTWQVKQIHKKYRPIVRINPDEVHINDPDFQNKVYCSSTPSKPMDKSGKFKHRFGIPEATFSTTHAEHHRVRRAALASFFSKQRIRGLNDKLSEITDRLSHRLSQEYARTGRVLNINDIWSSMTIEITSYLAFSRQVDCSLAPDFKSPLSVLIDVINWIPKNILSALTPPFKPILKFRANTRKQIKNILAGKETKGVGASHPTIFHDIQASDPPPEELTLPRLTDEAISLNGAGIETTK
ncbi:cytochrome P450 [Colletotrichum somersetense]|nr:cytochrome P450 [Colletotrichum somersetense]